MEIQAGTILEFESNSYVIKEYIDMGGNGSVWKAELPGDSRPYAIKILNNDASGNREKRARFDHECRFCKNTNNKNIVKIFDYIAEKGKAYCVMPYYSKNGDIVRIHLGNQIVLTMGETGVGGCSDAHVLLQTHDVK